MTAPLHRRLWQRLIEDGDAGSTDPRFTATLDAQMLYWTRLPAESRALTAQQQDYRFERTLPVPVENLHIVRSRLSDGSILLVGIEPGQLRTHLTQRSDVSEATWALVPDRIPEHLASTEAETARLGLNLLHGDFEPAHRRQARQRRNLILSVAAGVVLALVLGGIERRVTAQRQAAEALRRQGQELLAKTLGPSSGPVPNAALLTQELRRLEQAARSSTAMPLDTAQVLQRLWTTWPADLSAQVATVSLTQDRLVVRGSVPTLADAERLAKASPTITAGDAVFQAAPLQAEQTPRGAVFLITWHLQAAGSKGGAP